MTDLKPVREKNQEHMECGGFQIFGSFSQKILPPLHLSGVWPWEVNSKGENFFLLSRLSLVFVMHCLPPRALANPGYLLFAQGQHFHVWKNLMLFIKLVAGVVERQGKSEKRRLLLRTEQ